MDSPDSNPDNVPVIDLEWPRAVLVDALAESCESWGFFHLVNHGLDNTVVSRAYAAQVEFFARPLPEKRRHSRTLTNPWGYYDRELTKNLRDRKEIFDFGTDVDVPWPVLPADFQDAVQAYANACYPLCLRLLELLEDVLGLESPWLRDAFKPHHTSFTRLNHYPVGDPLEDSDAPPAGPLGISRHTDAGGLTILLQDAVAGLQMYHQDWRDVAPHDGALTVNIGDMLQVWSNDRFRAPLHRVLASRDKDRYSIAYFLNPARECVVEPLAVEAGEGARYRPVPWAEFRDLRAQGDYGDYGEEVQIGQYRVRS